MADVGVQRAVEQIFDPSYKSKWEFNFDGFLKREYGFSIDLDRPVCEAFKQGHCPRGPRCPDKHPASSSYTGLVCKHWLRGLCKKGETCEFLHEYNLRRMPECSFYSRHGYCSNGDDCLYPHIDPDSKRPSCPHYERGFCPLGPLCADKHVKKEKICPYYLAGFCPDGPDCKEGAHPKFPDNLPKPQAKVEKTPEQREQERLEREREREQEEQRERDREEKNPAFGGSHRGGRGGWQGRKNRSGKGRYRRQGY